MNQKRFVEPFQGILRAPPHIWHQGRFHTDVKKKRNHLSVCGFGLVIEYNMKREWSL